MEIYTQETVNGLPNKKEHILGTPEFRTRALPNGGHDMVLCDGCQCDAQTRRGPYGGVCGACGCAIPDKDLSP